MSIAKQVLEVYETEGRLVIPDGQKAVAVSYSKSSDVSDKRRNLAFVFADGSELCFDPTGVQLSLYHTNPGESAYSL